MKQLCKNDNFVVLNIIFWKLFDYKKYIVNKNFELIFAKI